jgi:hypothetical protein
MVLAPSPVSVDCVELPATAALLDMKVVAFVIGVDCSSAPVAPDNRQVRSVDLEKKRHINPHMAKSCQASTL